MELKFNSDTKHRKQWFTGLSFSHPAKMSLPLQLWIIENYTSEGEVILDPMSGSGTILVACSMGRDVIAVELEQKFCDMMGKNWLKIQQRGCQLGYSMGTCKIIQGDARNLEGVLADKIITSPPYAEMMQTPAHSRDDEFGQGKDRQYSNDASNIGNLPYGAIDKIVSSPPYEASVTGKSGIDWTKATRGAKEGWKPRDRTKEPSHEHLAGQGQPFNYSEDNDNIGNLKSDTYLEAMLQVYRQCYKVLKSGGLMILVTKNFLREQQEIRLDTDTIRLCEQAGFTFKERHYRRLPVQSFWRVIYAKKYPDAPVLDKEDVLVFEKAEL